MGLDAGSGTNAQTDQAAEATQAPRAVLGLQEENFRKRKERPTACALQVWARLSEPSSVLSVSTLSFGPTFDAGVYENCAPRCHAAR